MEEYQTDKMVYYDEAVAVLSWLFRRPLSERLNDTEKSKIREMYQEAKKAHSKLEEMTPQNTYAKNGILMKVGINAGCILALESIFGKEMFNE